MHSPTSRRALLAAAALAALPGCGSLLRRLGGPSAITGYARAHGEVLAWMRKATTGTTRIRAGLPRDWTIGDKTATGGTYGTANDVAIAHPPTGGPLIFAVYTNRRRKSADRHDATPAKTATRLHEALRRTM
ncbi:serine hydrolase [Actinoplanes sp. NPDC051633]|uniref:serine hydrolase n=1 Tax=Actinoplanes sp. NPDC051633 TaxID=3155670 RepID=UPI00341378BE